MSKDIVTYEQDAFQILRFAKEESQILQKCSDVIERFLSEDELFSSGRKKETARFYSLKDSATISDYLSSKKCMPDPSTVIGILDTKSRDLVFTTTGIIVPRNWHEAKEVPYGAICWLKNQIGIKRITYYSMK